jgi:nucleolar protein 15
MRAYFSQFGIVTRLRLSRNKKTGHSKHYAFIEFESEEVAEIVAETMDNYLLYGHILKCKVVPASQQHEKMWVGANRKYRVVPWAKINRLRHNRVKTGEQLERQRNRLLQREQKLREKLQDLGIEYDFSGYSGVVAQQQQQE